MIRDAIVWVYGKINEPKITKILNSATEVNCSSNKTKTSYRFKDITARDYSSLLRHNQIFIKQLIETSGDNKLEYNWDAETGLVTHVIASQKIMNTWKINITLDAVDKTINWPGNGAVNANITKSFRKSLYNLEQILLRVNEINQKPAGTKIEIWKLDQ